MIIDIHAHTSDHKLKELHTETATISDLETKAHVLGLSFIVLMATYFPYKGTGLNNQVLLKRIEGKHLFKLFGSLDIMNNFEAGLVELRDLAEQKLLIGIKLYPGYQDFHVSDTAIFDLYKLAAEYDIPVAIHAGELHGCCSYQERLKGNYRCTDCHIDRLAQRAHPSAFEEAIRAFPEVNFIICHLANPFFEDLRILMRKYSNVYTDLSGQFVSGRPSEDNVEYHAVIHEELKKFIALPNGVDRLLFGTDFPIQSYGNSIKLVRELNLSEKDEAKVFYHNAKKLLKL